MSDAISTLSEPGFLANPIGPIADVLRARALESEKARKPDDAAIEAIEATGLFGLMVPKRHGGLERGLSDLVDPIVRLGEGCTSTAWVASFYVAHSWIAALFPARARDEFFATKPHLRAPAPFAPTGTAVEVEGGYRLKGRWRWGTGVMHAEWAFPAALVAPAGKPPEARVFALPIADVTIADTWKISGMSATGSNDLVVDDVFVPAYRTIGFEAFKDGNTPGAEELGSRLYRIPMPPLLALTAALPALGAARASVLAFERSMKQRYMAYENKHQDERPAAQMRLARASATVHVAELTLRDLARRIDASVERDAPLSLAERAGMRMSAAHAVRGCRDAIATIAEAAGSSAYFEDQPIQRMLRDVTVLATHVAFDWDGTSEMYGRVLLGRKPGTVLV